LGSGIATVSDYLIFFGLLQLQVEAWLAQLVAHSSGMLINFFIQNRFIFNRKRGLKEAFFISLSFSMIAITLSSLSIHVLLNTSFFETYPIIAKLLVSGFIFIFNYYTKQFSFEKKITW
jgi:putative flippase GtrA